MIKNIVNFSGFLNPEGFRIEGTLEVDGDVGLDIDTFIESNFYDGGRELIIKDWYLVKRVPESGNY